MNSAAIPLLAELVVKSSALVLVALAATKAFPRISAARESTRWMAIFAALALLPAALLVAPGWTFPWPLPKITAAPASFDLGPEASVFAVSIGGGPALLAARPSSAEPTQDPLVVAWLAGATLVLICAAVGAWQSRRWRQRARRAPEAVTRLADSLAPGVPVRVAAGLAVPCVVGCWSPVILLPTGVDAWPHARLAATLRHEMAHVRRRDPLTRAFAQIVCAFLWMNPLVWHAASRLRAAQERACDDLVLTAGEDPTSYGTILLATVRDAQGGAPISAVAMARASTLETRLRALVDQTRDRSGSRPVGVCASVLVALATALIVAGAQAPANAAEATVPAASPSVGVGASPARPPSIAVEATIFEAPSGALSRVGTEEHLVLTAGEAEQALRNAKATRGVDMLWAPKLVTAAGNPAKIQLGRASQGTGELQEGITIAVTPKLVDGNISLDAKFENRRIDAAETKRQNRPPDSPVTRSQTYPVSAVLRSGDSLLMGGGDLGNGRQLFIFLKATTGGLDQPNGNNARPPQPAPSSTEASPLPEGIPDPKRPGFVTSPHSPYAGLIDVRGFDPGVAIKDPYSEKMFLVPGAKSVSAPRPAHKEELPFGAPVIGKPGFVTSPFRPQQGYVDVRGYAPGAEVKDPFTGRMFRVPPKDESPSRVSGEPAATLGLIQKSINEAQGAFTKIEAATSKDTPVDIKADETSFNGGRATARGNVRITYEGKKLTADEITYDPNTRILQGRNGKLVDAEGREVFMESFSFPLAASNFSAPATSPGTGQQTIATQFTVGDPAGTPDAAANPNPAQPQVLRQEVPAPSPGERAMLSGESLAENRDGSWTAVGNARYESRDTVHEARATDTTITVKPNGRLLIDGASQTRLKESTAKSPDERQAEGGQAPGSVVPNATPVEATPRARQQEN